MNGTLRGRTAAILAALAATAASPAAPQSDLAGPGRATAKAWPDRLFPPRALLPDLIAGPRDPVTLGQVVGTLRGETRFGAGVGGDVALSGTLPLVVLAGGPDGNALVLGIEGAAFARFSFDVVERELVNTDWVFAVPVVWRRGDRWLRLRYLHTSSHMGDEYGRRFGETGVNFSRDGAELVAYAPAKEGIGAYAGGFWSVNSHPEERGVWSVRGGIEVDPWLGMALRPYLGVDLEVEEATGREPRIAVVTGLWLPPVGGRPARVALELLRGPSPLGQFDRATATHVALGLRWDP